MLAKLRGRLQVIDDLHRAKDVVEWDQSTYMPKGVPNALMGEIANHMGISYSAWVTARPKSDWATMRTILEKTLELSRHLAKGSSAPTRD